MRYAISYISSAREDLQVREVMDILDQTNKFNKKQEITGLLLCNDKNFFQLIEGEEKTVRDLYARITRDPRHHNIIQFLDKPVSKPSFDGYLTDFIAGNNKFDSEKLEMYLHYIEVLNPKSEKAMNYLDASIRGIKFQKNKSQIPKSKNDASIGELNPDYALE